MRLARPISVALATVALARASALSVLVGSLLSPVFASTAFAEGKKGATEDSVVLKNGTMVTGKVLDDDPKTGVTIKTSNGKVRVIPAAEVKMVERAATPDEKPAKAEKAKPEKKADAEPAEQDEKPAKAKPDDAPAEPSLRDTTRWGFGGELGAVLSRANSGSDLKVLSPYIGIHAAIEIGLAKKLYLRVDPTVGTMSRSSEVPNVPNKLDAPSADPASWTLYRYSSVGTKLRLIEILARAELGYDFSPMMTSRIGVLGGAAIQMAKGDICDPSTDLGFVYGLSLHPVAARFGDKRNLEVALGVDYASVPVKRCTTSVPDGYVPVPNAVNQFQPALVRDRIGVGVVGLAATYMLD